VAFEGSSPAPPRIAVGWPLESSLLHGYLLDLDEELAGELDVRSRFAARRMVTAQMLEAEPGNCELRRWFDLLGEGPGLLIVDGLLAIDTRIVDRTSTELLGAGDLLPAVFRREEEMIEQVASWRALKCTRLAVLDGDFIERSRPWPQIVKALVRRAERRAEDLTLMRAICSQPKLELRLVLLLWHLSARWGKVQPGGLRLSLPLTHRLLGQLVSAERPSISHALGRLAKAGLVTGATNDLHLHGSLDSHLEQLTDHSTHPIALPPRHMERSRA
jgi:CRP/FNR family cyclic AMP-dependent transcriptional regulator